MAITSEIKKAGLANPTHNKVTFLGTGTSTGIPIPTCQCETCRSADPRDKRSRCSLLVEIGGLSLVIDTGPDFREQVLRHKVMDIDAVLYTHAHFDHVAGLCDLRAFLFKNRSPLPCYASPDVATEIERVYEFIFVEPRYPGTPDLMMSPVEDKFRVQSRSEPEKYLEVEPLEVLHGELPIFGFRIGNFAYITDVSAIPSTTMDKLKGLDVLVIGALRFESHFSHNSISESIEISHELKPRKTYFIHMTHSILHARDEVKLPKDTYFAYDGLEINLNA